ncbi:hypothetical protein ACQKP3_20835 [Vibrio sp. DNB22_10_4]
MLVKSQSREVVFVELLCSTEEVLNRLDSESRIKFKKLTDKELYKQVDKQGGFNFPPLPTSDLMVDTEKQCASVSAKLIFDNIRKNHQ